MKIRALELQGKKLSSVRIGIKKRVLFKRKADIVKIDSLYRSSRRIVVILSYFPGGLNFLGNHDIWSNRNRILGIFEEGGKMETLRGRDLFVCCCCFFFLLLLR